MRCEQNRHNLHKSLARQVSDQLRVPLQVVYPALDAKVKNVTVAYSVEHQDEVGSGVSQLWAAVCIQQAFVAVVHPSVVEPG